MKTPDAEWEKELKKFRLNYPVTTGYGATDVVFNMEDVIKKFIQELLTSRDTYWKERVRKEIPNALHEYARWLLENPNAEPLQRRARKNEIALALFTPITNEDNLK